MTKIGTQTGPGIVEIWIGTLIMNGQNLFVCGPGLTGGSESVPFLTPEPARGD